MPTQQFDSQAAPPRDTVRSSLARQHSLTQYIRLHISHVITDYSLTVTVSEDAKTAKVNMSGAENNTFQIIISAKDRDYSHTPDSVSPLIADRIIQFAEALHEAGHVLYTDHPAVKQARNDTQFTITNYHTELAGVFEDGAIEQFLREANTNAVAKRLQFKNTVKLFNKQYRKSPPQQKKHPFKISVPQSIRLACYELAKHNCGYLYNLLTNTSLDNSRLADSLTPLDTGLAAQFDTDLATTHDFQLTLADTANKQQFYDALNIVAETAPQVKEIPDGETRAQTIWDAVSRIHKIIPTPNSDENRANNGTNEGGVESERKSEYGTQTQQPNIQSNQNTQTQQKNAQSQSQKTQQNPGEGSKNNTQNTQSDPEREQARHQVDPDDTQSIPSHQSQQEPDDGNQNNAQNTQSDPEREQARQQVDPGDTQSAPSHKPYQESLTSFTQSESGTGSQPEQPESEHPKSNTPQSTPSPSNTEPSTNASQTPTDDSDSPNDPDTAQNSPDTSSTDPENAQIPTDITQAEQEQLEAELTELTQEQRARNAEHERIAEAATQDDPDAPKGKNTTPTNTPDTDLEFVTDRPDPNIDARDRASQIADEIITPLERSLENNQQTGVNRGRRSGSLDSPRLSHALAGNTRVCKRYTRPDEKEYNVILILDRSGSMSGDRIRAAEHALGGFTLALTEFGTDVSVFDLYNGTPRVVIPFTGSPADNLPRLFTRETGGRTPLRKPLRIARNRLLQANTYSFIICVTDGEPDKTDDYLTTLTNTPIPVIGITVNDGRSNITNPDQYYDTHRTVTSESELTDTLQELAATLVLP